MMETYLLDQLELVGKKDGEPDWVGVILTGDTETLLYLSA